MALDPHHLPDAIVELLGEYHLATLTTLRPDGSPHVVAVGCTWDPEAQLVRVITRRGSRKARNLLESPGSRAAVCQVAGPRWVTFEGPAVVTDDPERVAEAVRRYTERYRPPAPSEERVAIEISVDRVLGSG